MTEILIAANELKAFPTVVVMDRTVHQVRTTVACIYVAYHGGERDAAGKINFCATS